MSEYDVRQVGNVDEQYSTTSANGSNNRIAQVLSTGNVGNGQYVAENQNSTEIDLEKRKKMIALSVEQHPGTTEETFYEYAEKYYQYDKNTFLNLPNERFDIVAKDIESKIEEQFEELHIADSDIQKTMDKVKEATQLGVNFEAAAEIAKQTVGEDIDIKDVVKQTKIAQENGLNAQNAVKVATIVGKSIIDIINQYSDKTFNSLDEISFDELKAIISKIIKSFMPSKDDDIKTRLEKNDTFRYLFKCVASQKDVDIEKIYSAFKAVVSEYSQKMKSLLETIEGLKTKSKEELKQLLLDGTAQKLLAQYGITGEQAESILDMITKLLNDEKLTTEDIFNKISTEFRLDSIKDNSNSDLLFNAIDTLKSKSPQELKQLIDDGTVNAMLLQSKIPEDQIRSIIANLSKILDDKGLLDTNNSNIGEEIFRALVDGCEFDNIIKHIEAKDENARNDEDNYYLKLNEIKNKIREGKEVDPKDIELYNEYLANAKSLGNSIAASLIQRNQKLANVAKNEYSERFDDIMHELVIYVNENPDVKVDFAYLDSLTDGKFSSYNEEYVVSLNDSSSGSAEGTSVAGSDYGYANASGNTYNTALNNVSNLVSQLYTDDDDTYTVLNNKKSANQNQLQISQTSAARSGKLFDEAWAQGIIDIKYLGENFNNACAKGVRKVWNFLDRNQQNRIDFLQAWHNTELSSESAERYDMDKDEIAELKLSIGQTNVLQNRYDDLHKNEADKPDLG